MSIFVLFYAQGLWAAGQFQTQTVPTVSAVTTVAAPSAPVTSPFAQRLIVAPPAAAATTGTAVPLRPGGVPPTNQTNANSNGGQNNPSQAMQQIIQSMGQGGGAGGGRGNGSVGVGAGQPYHSSNAAAAAPSGQDGFQYVEPGKLETCPPGSVIPANVTAALKEAQDFRAKCPATQNNPNKMIAINDYSCLNSPPQMWIFDENGCRMHTAITFGFGPGQQGRSKPCPLACSQNSDHETPPGFHLTALHPQSSITDYGPKNSMYLRSLENQGSQARGVLIHQADQPGTASSEGCSGVCQTCYDQIAQTLKFGALVYNYFGSPPNVDPNCPKKDGATHNPARCALEGGGPLPSGTPERGDSASAQ